MKKTVFIAALLLCAVAAGVTWAIAGSSDDKESMYDLVSKDFLAGVAGDKSALERALKTCENVLTAEPNNAAAMAWQGAGWLYLSGFAFQRNDVQTGIRLSDGGMKRLDQAVALAPNDPEVLITRGTTLVQWGLHDPNPESAKAVIDKGLKELLNALDKVGHDFSTWPADPRGQLLSTIADGSQRVGLTDQARSHYQRIVNELPGTVYAETAKKHLQN